MEMFSGLSPGDIMKIPSTRRHRLILKKVELEKQRAANADRQLSQARARSRR